jgi:hypothetical protein
MDALLKRFLFPKIAQFIARGPALLIDMAWGLLWPWPGVIKQWDEIETQTAKFKNSLWDFEFSKAADAALGIWRGINGIVGQLYGWFFIAAVLIGAIFASPQAGAAVAYEVGEVLLASTLIAEGLSIEKARLNLMSKSRLAKAEAQRAQEDDEDYQTIADSTMNLAILGIMAILGAIAVDFAKAVFAELKNIFLPRGAEAPKLELPGGAPKGEPALKEPASKPAEVGGEPAEPLSEDTAARAERNGVPREQLQAEVGELRQKAANPDNVHQPADPAYDAEMDAEGHTFDRNKADHTWCRHSAEVCGLSLGDDLNSAVDSARQSKPAEPPTPKEPTPTEPSPTGEPAKPVDEQPPAEPAEPTDPKAKERAQLEKDISDLKAKKGQAEAKANELRTKAKELEARAKELDRQASISKGEAKAKLRQEWRETLDAVKDAKAAADRAFDEAKNAQLDIQKKTQSLADPAHQVATSWEQHEQLVTDSLKNDYPGKTIGTQVTLDVTNPATGETVQIRIDDLVPQGTGAKQTYQLVDAKFSSAKNLANPATNLADTLTPNQTKVYDWIKSGQPVTVVPEGPNAIAAGLTPGVPINVNPSVEIHVNGPGGRVVRQF